MFKVLGRVWGFVEHEPLPASFFERDPTLVARELLGHVVIGLADGQGGPPPAGRIVETEAYLGPEDGASHAARGPASQGGALWGEPGTAYVYICYGIHRMLNVVAHEPGGVGAVLLRAAEPVASQALMARRRGIGPWTGDEAGSGREPGPEADLLSGPGKLAQALGIEREAHEGSALTEAPGPLLARGDPVAPEHIAVGPRIGISKATDLLLRFVDETSPMLSQPAP